MNYSSKEDAEYKSIVANRRAQQIYMDVIENNKTESYLKENLKYINGAHLNDIAEERSISGVCGYPLCLNSFKDTFGHGPYIVRRNRVYNIILRRLFCSNKCFHAFEIVKNQLPETPLFLRSIKDPEFNNLQISFPDINNIKGKYGQLIDIGCIDHTLITKETNSTTNKRNVTFENNIVEESEVKIVDEDNQYSSEKCADEIDMDEVSEKLENFYIDSDTVRQDGKPLQDDNKQSKKLLNSNPRCDESSLSNVIKVEQKLREMVSFETLKLVLGEVYVCGMLKHLGKTYDDVNDMFLSLEAKSRYVNLCKKMDTDLNIVDLEDKDEKPTNTIPDYEHLRNDINNCTVKVKSFYKSGNNENESQMECEELSLPLIDSYSQMQWRRKIFNDKLFKYLPHHIKKLNLNQEKIINILRPIIFTLDLSPHNLYFTKSQWDIVCLGFLKLLTVRYNVVMQAFIDEGLHIEELLSNFGIDSLYFDRLLSFLTDIDYIIKKNMPSKFNENDK